MEGGGHGCSGGWWGWWLGLCGREAVDCGGLEVDDDGGGLV